MTDYEEKELPMATLAHKLTFEEFKAQYGPDNKTHEYWYGEAIPKGMPTWIHGLLQQIVMQLLRQQGFFAASEVELRIDPNAHPRPDVVASKNKPRGQYPTEGLDVVVEIISEDDRAAAIREHCQKYQEWQCKEIYLVYPGDRSVVQWQNGSEIACSELAGIPVGRIWEELDAQYSG